MSQRHSQYIRKEREAYATPSWVTRVVIPHLRHSEVIWEPAAGEGHMAAALMDAGFKVIMSDIVGGVDFLIAHPTDQRISAIVTNPPYSHAELFIIRALELMRPRRGQVAMLLRADFDSGKTRTKFFRDCPAWAKKIVLLQRIVWFEPEPRADGKKPAGPSENHAFYIWDWCHEGPPTIGYGP